MINKVPLVSSICSECGGRLEFPLGAMQVRCEHCQAGMAVDPGQRLLRLDCPRCRGNFYYLDGALCGRCPYCDASLLAVTRDRLLRYLVRPAAPAPEQGARLLLLPFWHLSGLVYGWDIGKRVEIVEERGGDAYVDRSLVNEPEVVGRVERRDSGPQRFFRGRVVSQSLADAATLSLGVTSLGVRGSVFPVEPFSAEAESVGEVVPPALAAKQAREHLNSRALDLAHGELTHVELQRAELVAEALSLFYYPYWALERAGGFQVWDAVSGQPERLATPTPAPAAAGGINEMFDELKILELSCASCGRTLMSGNNARVLPCSGCGLHWEVTRDGLRPFAAHAASPHRAAARTAWLPFWRIQVKLDYEGCEAARVADIRNVLGMHSPPGEVPGAEPSSPLHYYVPAYGALRAPRLDVAARDMTRLQPLLEDTPRGAGEIYNCFLGPEDARRLAYVTWLQFLPPVPRRLRSFRIVTGEISLWYMPFADSQRELCNLVTGHRYDRSVFRGVRH